MNILDRLKGLTLEECIVFVLGFFSTFQLLEVFGATVFSLILIAYAAYICVVRHRLVNGSIAVWVYAFVVCVSEIGLILSGKHTNWISASIKNAILLMCVIIVYMYLVNKSDKYIKLFFLGIYGSCIFQLMWCVAQFVCNKVLSINLNEVVFQTILHMNGDLYQIKDGILVLTGLTSNAGVMVPVLIFGMALSKPIWMKLAFMVIALLMGSTTPIIAVLCFMGLYILFKGLDMIIHREKISLMSARCIFIIVVIAMIVITAFILSNGDIVERLYHTAERFILRIGSIFTGEFIDGSTATHARYYLEIPYIYSRIPIFNILFGYGMSCAGIPFVELFNQYADGVWVPESDVATFLFNSGLVGCLIFYGILLWIMIRGKRVDYMYFILICTILISGVFYGIQTHWVILSELLLLVCMQRKVKINDIF